MAAQRRRPLFAGTGPSSTQRTRICRGTAAGHPQPRQSHQVEAPKTTHDVDRRCVVNHAQARRLFSAVREQMPSGSRLAAFFAVIYYTALRPEEAVNLAKTTSACRRSPGTALQANGRNRPMTGKNCDSAQPRPKSALNGRTRAAATTTGTSKPEPAESGGTCPFHRRSPESCGRT
jgi:hypothetical protein